MIKEFSDLLMKHPEWTTEQIESAILAWDECTLYLIYKQDQENESKV
jgi:hypothetical protein